MSFRSWLSIVTFVLIGALLYAARKDIAHAWHLLGQVDVWILLLLLPLTMASYMAAGEMMFSYLRGKKSIGHLKPWTLARMSLELNFVNHVLPSGGVSGISYMNWRLGRYGVASGKATMAQAVRYIAGFAALATLLAISVLVVTIDGHINRWIILMSSGLVTTMIVSTLVGIYLIRSPIRLKKFSHVLATTANRIAYKLTRGRKRVVAREDKILSFFEDMHDDYLFINRERKILIKPYLWGLFFTVVEVVIFYTVFMALGAEPFNPAPLLIGYGVASVAGFLVVTPGGTGAYETVMVMVLVAAQSMVQSEAIAGVILARVIILLTTIGLGYIFYQHAITHYGKPTETDTNTER